MASHLIQLLLLLTILLLPVSNTIRKTVTVVSADIKLENRELIAVNIATSKEFRTEVLSTGADHDHTPTRFEIPYLDGKIECLSSGSLTNVSLIFTQGATGGISSPYITNFFDGFSELKSILIFNGRQDLQLRVNMFKSVIGRYHSSVIGGRSLGSRVAIETSNEVDNVDALILVSFPLKSAKGENRDHLLFTIDESTEVLFVIGSKDRMCELEKFRSLMKRMKAKTWLVVVNDANHKMELVPSIATRPIGKMVGRVVARWIEEHDDMLTNCEIHWDKEKREAVAGPWNDEL